MGGIKLIDKKVWEFIERKINKNIEGIGKAFPQGKENGEYREGNVNQWTAGFWPGILWKAYQVTENESYAMLARELETELDKRLIDPEQMDQNSGMIWTLASLADYKTTGSQEAKRRALLAANLLLARFNVAGEFISSRSDLESENNKGYVTIDSVVNISLLLWATVETEDPRFKHVAEAHLTTIINYFISEEASVYPACLFDAVTGELIEELDESFDEEENSASKGVAWAIYGFALAARYTRRPEFFDAAKLLADEFLEELEETVKETPVAAAIVANGLVTLAKLTGVTSYRKDAEAIVMSLYSYYSTKNHPQDQSLLLAVNENNHGKSGIVGDYFFTEAVVALLFDKELFW